MAEVRPVVLVHGAWHGAWCWAPLQAELDRRGIASYAVDLPGRGTSLGSLGSLHDDADHVSGVLDALDRDVVLVGHSYGGAVVGQAAADGAPVAAVVYLAAFALVAGETVNDVVRANRSDDGKLSAAILMRDDGTSVLDPTTAPAALYGACDAGVVRAALDRIGAHFMFTFDEAVDRAPFGRFPTVYVRCTLDAAVPLVQQDAMASRCDEIVTLETDHSPFASATGAVADLLERLATAGSPR